jgi:hypothetical protein
MVMFAVLQLLGQELLGVPKNLVDKNAEAVMA